MISNLFILFNHSLTVSKEFKNLIYKKGNNMDPSSMSSDLRDYYNTYGNATIEEADVIIITNTHDRPKDHQNNVAVVQRIRKNHLILAEGTAAGKEIPASENITTKGLAGKVTGMDSPTTLKEIEQLNQRLGRINALFKQLQADLNSGKWGSYFSTEGAFESVLQYAPKAVKQKKDEIRTLLANQNMPAFLHQFNLTMDAINNKHKRKVVKMRTRTFPERQDYFENSIEQGIKTAGKAIVFMGTSHVIRNSRLTEKEYDVTKFQNYLKTKKFVVLNPKDSPVPSPWNNMPELWSTKPSSLEVKEESKISRSNKHFEVLIEKEALR